MRRSASTTVPSLARREPPHLRFVPARSVQRFWSMPEQKTRERARRARRAGKSPTTQAGEFVREEIHHVREGKHGARSAKQAIAIGLQKARKAGVQLPPPPPGKTSERTRRSAERAYEKGQRGEVAVSKRRSRAVEGALQRESTETASAGRLARQAHQAAMKRTPAERSRSARKAVETKGPTGRKRAAKKAAAARTRRRR